jgi:hypothetical protein
MQADFRWFYLTALGVLVSLVSVFAAVQPAEAYGAAQTEAQSDPYAFPNVDLCCKPKPPRVPYCVRFPNAWSCVCKNDRGENPLCNRRPEEGPTLTVDCGAASYPGSRFFTSLQEAVDYARRGSTIFVRGGFPGGDCREHVHIQKSLTIVGQGPSPAIINGCVTVTGEGRPTVHLRNLQILGTTTGLNGTSCARPSAMYTGFDGRSYPQRILDDYAVSALSVAGSTVHGEGLLVRSAQAALDTEHSVVSMSRSTLAAIQGAGFSVRMDRTEATFNDVIVAGGSTGISAHMLDRHPVRFNRVDVQNARSQFGEYSKGGRALIVRVFDEGLPALLPGQSAAFTWTGGSVQGFRNAVEVGPGVLAAFNGLRIAAVRGFDIRAGAQADLSGNTIERIEEVGINVESGAGGSAIANNLSRKEGRCFCVGRDCDNDDEDIRSHHFVLRGNVCRSERSGLFGW